MQWSFGSLVIRVGQLWRRTMGQALADHGMSQATALPLIVLLRQEQEIRQIALAEAMGIEGPSLVPLLDALENDGLVERLCDPEDRRAKLVRLTPAGRTKAEEVEAVVDTVRNRIFRSIAPEDRQKTEQVLLEVYQIMARGDF